MKQLWEKAEKVMAWAKDKVQLESLTSKSFEDLMSWLQEHSPKAAQAFQNFLSKLQNPQLFFWGGNLEQEGTTTIKIILCRPTWFQKAQIDAGILLSASEAACRHYWQAHLPAQTNFSLIKGEVHTSGDYASSAALTYILSDEERSNLLSQLEKENKVLFECKIQVVESANSTNNVANISLTLQLSK